MSGVWGSSLLPGPFGQPTPTILSAAAITIPVIDGAYSPGEWSDALVVDLSAIPGNAVPGFLLVKNDADFLYIAYDGTGDMTQDVATPGDVASVAFDTDNDGIATDGREDQFVQGGWVSNVSNDQAHHVYSSSAGAWIVEDSPYDPGLPNHVGLESAWGFGTSDNSPTNHRVYEFAIPLALLGVAPGDTLGFFGGSSPAPGLYDDSIGGWSLWPIWSGGPLPLSDYGDLILAPGVVHEHDIAVLGLQAPDFLRPGDTTLVNATIRNVGLNNETNIVVNFTVDGVTLDSTTIPFLGNGTSTTVSFPWTPSLEANYTACIEVQPVPAENVTTNNAKCKAVRVDFPPTIVSPDANILPAIDGVYSPGEWGDALVVDLSAIPGNTFPSLLLVKNDADFLYIAFDATGDTVEHSFDQALLIFDTGNDEVASDGDEDAFLQESIQAHYLWSVASATYLLEDSPYDPSLPDHLGLASARGFGASDNDPTSHRIYEFSIPLLLVGAAPGDTLGFFGGVLDSGGFSFWPIPLSGPLPPLSDYGDLILAPGVVHEHDIAVLGLQAPDFLRLGDTALVNATIRNVGLNNETNIVVNFTVDGVMVDNAVIPFMETGTSTIVSFSWTAPLTGGTYRVGIETAPVPGENVTTNNNRTLDVLVSRGPDSGRLALISDSTELQLLTPMLDALGVAYDVLDDNDFTRHTEDLALLLQYQAIVYYTHFGMGISERDTLEGYAQLGGKLVVTGFDSLIGPSPLADLVRSTSVGNGPFSSEFTVTEGSHPVMDGVLGSFPTGSTHDAVVVDHDQAEADTARGAQTIAELTGGRDKIIVTELPGGGIVTYWNGAGPDDWLDNPDLERMFKNLLDWYLDGPLDSVPPVTSITSPFTGALLATSDVSVVWSASDPGSGVTRMEVRLDDGLTEVLPASASSRTFAGLPDGSHAITVTAYDLFENFRTATVAFTVDTTPPTVSVSSPLAGEAVGTSSVDVSWSVTDHTSGVNRVEVSLDDGVPVPLAATASGYTFTDVADGPHTITVRAFDVAGNLELAVIDIIVDTVKPTAVAGEDQTVNAGDTVSFDASASSDDVAIVIYAWDFGDGTTGTGETTTHAYSDPGTYTVTLTVRDAAGNTETDVLIVTVETEPVNPIPPEVVTYGVVAAIAAVAAVAALLLWRRRARGKEKA